MEVACEIEMIKDPDTRRSNIAYVARHIEDALASQREYRTGATVRLRHWLAKCCWFGKRYGNYLVCLYLVVKLLYILNVVGQFFFMSRVLGTNYTFYGLDLLRDLAYGHEWQESGNFPRVTMCDFLVRRLANTQRYTVQCVLPINMFNEKIFIFLWFWFILVAAINSSSFFYWSYKSSFGANRLHFVRKFLKLRNALESGDKKRTSAFVNCYLRQDGVFILRLVAQNAGELVASELVERLWLMYKSSLNNERIKSLGGDDQASAKSSAGHLKRPHRRTTSVSSESSSRGGEATAVRRRPPVPPSYVRYEPPNPPPIGFTNPDLSVPSTTGTLNGHLPSDSPPPLPPPPGSSRVTSSSSGASSGSKRSASKSEQSLRKAAGREMSKTATAEDDPGDVV